MLATRKQKRIPLLDLTEDAAKIRAFFIHPKCARLGLGSMLLKHCEQEAKLNGFKRIELMATLPGVKLYQVMAYKAVSNEVALLPDKTSLRFVRMKKNIYEALITGL